MSLQTLAFLLGCGLIVIGIVGGGIEAREVKVPKLSPIPRILSAVFGIGLVVGAVGGLSGYAGGPPDASAANAAPVGALANSAAPVAPPPAAPAAAPPPAATGAAVDAAAAAPEPPEAPAAPARPGLRMARLSDTLNEQQEYERIQVFVGGRQVGLIAVDRNNRRQIINVEVAEGDEYTLVGSEASRYPDGSLRIRTIRGGGTFDGEHTNYLFMGIHQTAEILTAELQGQ
jgi:hypothetical protein